MGLEILEQVPDLDAAIIPVGGGGLIAGVAKALKTMKPGVKIIVIISYLILQNYKINNNVLYEKRLNVGLYSNLDTKYFRVSSRTDVKVSLAQCKQVNPF